MTLETALAAIVTAEKHSTLSTEAFYTALARLAAMDHMLRTVLVPGSYTIGKSSPIEAPRFIEPLVASPKA